MTEESVSLNASDSSVGGNYPLNLSDSSVVGNYTEFSREAFWEAYHWQAAVSLQRSGFAKTGGHFLDIGCGPGWMTFILQDRCPLATCCGVDLSVTMVNQARALAQRQGYQEEQIQFVVGDAQHLPFPNNSFDLIVSSSSFRMWGDQVRGLQEAYRVLRPGGLLYVADLGNGATPEDRQVILNHAPLSSRSFVKVALETAFPLSKVEGVFRQTGLSGWECRVGGICGFYPTDPEVMDWLRDGFPLRDLQKKFRGSEWAHEIRKYWMHIYIRKPQE